MTRHLIEPHLRSALDRGKSVEQFLGGSVWEGEPVVRWIEIRQDSDEFVLSFYQVYDEGSEEWLDLYEFQPAMEDPDEDCVEHTFATLDAALAFASAQYGVDPARFVNEGVIQDEYRDYLLRRRDDADAAGE